MKLERLWTVRDVMEVLPYGKTKVTSIINSIPHINDGKKLLVDPMQIHEWIRSRTVDNSARATKPMRRRMAACDGLTEDGLIPYRRKK